MTLLGFVFILFMKVNLLTLFLTLCLCSCYHLTWQDQGIDPEIKLRIDRLDKEVIDSLIVKAGLPFDPTKFRIKNQIYIKNAEGAIEMNRLMGMGKHNYALDFRTNKEMFATVGYFEDSINTHCLTLMYGKFGDDWKLTDYQVGLLRIRKRDAIDWYLRAKDEFAKNDIADAASDLNIGDSILHPANQIWHYEMEQQVLDFTREVDSALRRRLN
jgi:hypothetical protein